jgi:hypothetical protein
LKGLQKAPESLQSFRRQVLLQQGLELLDDDSCPLCDTAWNMSELQVHLEQKLEAAKKAAETLASLQNAVQPILDNYEEIQLAATKLIQICNLAEPKLKSALIASFVEVCGKDHEILEQVCKNPALLEAALAVLSKGAWVPATEVLDSVIALGKYVKALPDPSKEELAREFLIVAQEHYERCRLTTKERAALANRSEVAAKVAQLYGTSSTAVLEGIYDAVEKDFTDYYRIINQEDEGKFEGKLTPSPAKLAFDVDFYGRGKFPPGAYHSEGHQDGMGLCLYLALMNHTLGKNFTFAVLDDVLMSVDSGHRREVCTLLKSKFPDTQFILTTHDPVWLQFMKTENLIEASVSFAGWTVDTGPQAWNEGDVWQQIGDKLAKGDVPGAAGTLRRYLEFMSTMLADNLRASVEYHGNGSYDLGDLMPPVVRAWKSQLKRAKDAASSWGQDITVIEAFEKKTNAQAAATNAEQWMINKAVHFNAWATLQVKEFESVVAAFRSLLETMRCQAPKCGEFLHVSPRKGHEKQALRCGCGAISFNLNKK